MVGVSLDTNRKGVSYFEKKNTHIPVARLGTLGNLLPTPLECYNGLPKTKNEMPLFPRVLRIGKVSLRPPAMEKGGKRLGLQPSSCEEKGNCQRALSAMPAKCHLYKWPYQMALLLPLQDAILYCSQCHLSESISMSPTARGNSYAYDP